jgi:DNA-binding response OmpR family regulator
VIETNRPFPMLLAALTEAGERRQLLDGLPHYGWRVLIATAADEVAALAFQHTPDVLLLDADIVVAPIPALEAVHVPRVVLCAEPDREQRLRLHREIRACAWLSRPLDLELLAAQLDAAVFGCQDEAASPVEVRQELRAGEDAGEWLISRTTWMLSPPQGTPVRLTQAETTFLAMLAENPGEPVPRPAMIVALGHNVDYYDTRRLDTLISRLRQKVSRDSGVPLPVRSIHSVGYAFAASITLTD